MSQIKLSSPLHQEQLSLVTRQKVIHWVNDDGTIGCRDPEHDLCGKGRSLRQALENLQERVKRNVG